MAEPTPPPQHAGLRVIALFKLAKASLLITVGLGSFRLLNDDLSEVARTWAKHLNIDPENHIAHSIIMWAASVQPIKLRHFGYIVLLFALDQIIEGIGLWYNQTWAKYLLLVATSLGFIWETRQLIRDPSIIHQVGVGVCVVILLYLGWLARAGKRPKNNQPGLNP